MMPNGISATQGMIGLLFFFVFFLGVVIWVFRPGSKKTYEEQAQIPLKENGLEENKND